jgi:hypothetical protein
MERHDADSAHVLDDDSVEVGIVCAFNPLKDVTRLTSSTAKNR